MTISDVVCPAVLDLARQRAADEQIFHDDFHSELGRGTCMISKCDFEEEIHAVG